VAPPSNDDINNEPKVRAAQVELDSAKADLKAADDSSVREAAQDRIDSAQMGLDAAVYDAKAAIAHQLAMLPSELEAELELDNNEKWIRGYAYFPENHSAGINRAPGDVTTVDDPNTPVNLTEVKVQPWDVGTKFTQSALTWQASDYIDRAKRQNDLTLYSNLEYEFWTGTLARAHGWPNNYLAKSTTVDVTPINSLPAVVDAASAPTLPLTIVHATNDEFIFTSVNDPHSPDTFVIAPGTYTTIGELVAAVSAATSTASGNLPFSTYVVVSETGGKLVFTEVVRGTNGNSDTITEGNGGAAAMGFSSLPGTFAGGRLPTAVSVVRGLGILQTIIARSGAGAQGMIHLTPEAAPNLLNSRRVGKYLLDQFDNVIVPGVGYPGTGPSVDAPPSTASWMYATDMVSTRIQKDTKVFPDSFAEALDRSQDGNPNTITFRAQRLAGASWDGFIAAGVLVTLPT
jgi:hypothetical protein